jgi:hypothetical protein
MRLDEVGNQSAIAGALAQGLEVLDLQKQVKFRRYNRVVLPLDGYLFWQPAEEFEVEGSLHFTQDIQQNEDETFGSVSITFTVTQRIAAFETSPIESIFVGRIADIDFAFSQQGARYDQAGLWHYAGHSIPPALQTQLISETNQPDPTQAIISNSLPLWLALNGFVSPLPGTFSNNVKLYPSGLVPSNLRPPYAAVHIGENDTRAISASPYVDPDSGSSYQMAADMVRVMLYGLTHKHAMQFLNFVEQYSVYYGGFGIMNMPIVRDAKRTFAELQTIAMKKVIDFEVSYDQHYVDVTARKLIKSASVSFILGSELTGNVVVDDAQAEVVDHADKIVTSLPL